MEIKSKKAEAFIKFLSKRGIYATTTYYDVDKFEEFLSKNIVCDGYHNSINLGAYTLIYHFLEDGPCAFKLINNLVEDFRYWDYGE